MITEQDLKAAIAECLGQRKPDANTCIKLSAFYTIMEHMFPDAEAPAPRLPAVPEYAYAAAPEPTITMNSGTEFARLIDGRNPDEIMPLIDEAMTLLQAAYPKLYSVIMEKLR